VPDGWDVAFGRKNVGFAIFPCIRLKTYSFFSEELFNLPGLPSWTKASFSQFGEGKFKLKEIFEYECFT